MTNGRHCNGPVAVRAGCVVHLPECRQGLPARREADWWPDLGVHGGDVVLPYGRQFMSWCMTGRRSSHP
jgi:hypothetical protein